jgi:hypothetical protein
MNLYENTMTQVFLKDGGLAADLSAGGVTVDAAPASEGITLSSGKIAVKVASGSAVSASSSPVTRTGGGISLQVLKGTATVAGNDNMQRTIDAGNAVVISSDGSSESVPPVIVTSPAPDEKILYHKNTPLDVRFCWKTNDIPAGTPVILELSGIHDFSTIDERITVTGLHEVYVPLDPGTRYWRLRSGMKVSAAGKDTAVFASGKMQVLRSLPPQIIAPAQGYAYMFRTRKPAVRFIWSNSEYATSYELVVADNPSLRNPVVSQRTALASSIIASLGAGTWYCQVTPYYTINNAGLESPSAVSSFTIAQQGELRAPQLLIPSADSFVNTKNGAEGTGFSWQQSTEAVEYTLAIAGTRDLLHPVVRVTTNENYCIIDPGQQNLKNGRWYWGVTQTDSEGNVSPLSDVRSFFAVDGKVVQRTIFPPDRYRVSSSYMQNLRFTWKTNIPFPTRMQIARDGGFTDLVYNSVIATSALDGRNLAEGTYYWRITADTDLMELSSPVKMLTVVGPLSAPLCSDPADNTRAVIRPETPYTFTWRSVDGADYYKFRLYKEGGKTPVCEQGLIEGTSVCVAMEQMEEGPYRWTVQPFAGETDLSSRRTGLLGESRFQMKKLRPVTLVTPVPGTEFDGIQAVLDPGTAVWSTVDHPAGAEFILTKTDGHRPQVVMDVRNPPERIQLDRLRAGTYSWTVKARTLDDLDISALGENTFTVLPIAPLPASQQISPCAGSVFDAACLRTTRTVAFSWQKVPGATGYIITIRKSSPQIGAAGRKILEKDVGTDTSYTLQDLAALDRGSFEWSVEAVRAFDGSRIMQRGIPAEGSFVIDLPVLKKPLLEKTGILYGK